MNQEFETLKADAQKITSEINEKIAELCAQYNVRVYAQLSMSRIGNDKKLVNNGRKSVDYIDVIQTEASGGF